MPAKGSAAYGAFAVTHDITTYTRAKLFSGIGKATDLILHFGVSPRVDRLKLSRI